MNHFVSEEDFGKLLCPNCGKEMAHGYITGKGTGLRWSVNEKTKTIFAGTKLRKKTDWWNAPNLESLRCDRCKIGVFRYDY